MVSHILKILMWDLILVLDYDPKVPLCVHAGPKEALSKEVSLQKNPKN